MMEETESWDMYVQALDEFLSRKYLWAMDRLIVLKKKKKEHIWIEFQLSLASIAFSSFKTSTHVHSHKKKGK